MFRTLDILARQFTELVDLYKSSGDATKRKELLAQMRLVISEADLLIELRQVGASHSHFRVSR